MVELWLPYGNTEVPVRIPDENSLGSLLPTDYENTEEVQDNVLEALRNPRQGRRLKQIVDRKDKVSLVLEDPKDLLPIELIFLPVLSELESLGIEKENISIIVSWTDRGSHGSSEIGRKIRERVDERMKVVFHDPARSPVVQLESTSSGTNVEINETYTESDVRIVLGEVRFDNLAGYTGSGTAIVPGLASSRTIHETLSVALKGDCGRRIFEKNPLSQEIVETSEIAGVDFLLTTVLDQRNEIAGVFGGTSEGAFSEARRLVDQIWKRPIDDLADIVVVSAGGSAFDSHFYKALDSIDAATSAVQDKGAIILVAECRGGPGSKDLQRYAREYRELNDLRRAIRREATITGYKSLRLREVVERHEVTIVSAMPDFYSKKVFGLRTAKTANDAIASSLRRQGSRTKTLVIPQGTSTTSFHSSE
jgi:nickel-dependent lactate racemase